MVIICWRASIDDGAGGYYLWRNNNIWYTVLLHIYTQLSLLSLCFRTLSILSSRVIWWWYNDHKIAATHRIDDNDGQLPFIRRRSVQIGTMAFAADSRSHCVRRFAGPVEHGDKNQQKHNNNRSRDNQCDGCCTQCRRKWKLAGMIRCFIIGKRWDIIMVVWGRYCLMTMMSHPFSFCFHILENIDCHNQRIYNKEWIRHIHDSYYQRHNNDIAHTCIGYNVTHEIWDDHHQRRDERK